MTVPHNSPKVPRWVSVTAPARLHLGFVDLNGGLGRRFGSLGIALDWPCTRLVLRRTAKPEPTARGPDAERTLRYARALLQRLELPNVEIVIEQVIPAHAGLGSGTQMALAVGMGLARLFGHSLDAAGVAALLGRGVRSGIGIGAFEQGGFLVDGGRGRNTSKVPPLLARLPLPVDWRVLLIFDTDHRGIHGQTESEVFAALPEFTEATAAHLCRLLLMQALPALAEGELGAFGTAISDIQRSVGNYFAPLQGGRFTSPAVAGVLEWLVQQGIAGVGQSSWGPTGFALCADEIEGQRLLRLARRRWCSARHLGFALVKPRNRAALVEDCRIRSASSPYV